MPDTQLAYVKRRMSDLDAAPRRPSDMRVRVVLQPRGDMLVLHLEWYKGAASQISRGPNLEVKSSALKTPNSVARVAKDLLNNTPDFVAQLRRRR